MSGGGLRTDQIPSYSGRVVSLGFTKGFLCRWKAKYGFFLQSSQGIHHRGELETGSSFTIKYWETIIKQASVKPFLPASHTVRTEEGAPSEVSTGLSLSSTKPDPTANRTSGLPFHLTVENLSSTATKLLPALHFKQETTGSVPPGKILVLTGRHGNVEKRNTVFLNYL